MKKAFLRACSFRGTVQNGGECGSRWPRQEGETPSLQPQTGSTGLELGSGYELSMPASIDIVSPAKAPPPKHSTTSPNSITNQGPNLQVHDLMEDIYHSDHSRLWLAHSPPTPLRRCFTTSARRLWKKEPRFGGYMQEYSNCDSCKLASGIL